MAWTEKLYERSLQRPVDAETLETIRSNTRSDGTKFR